MRAALPAVTARPHVGPLRGHRLRRLCIDPCGWRPPLHHKNVLFEVPVGAALPQLPCRHTVQVEATLTEEVLHRPHRHRIDVADAALGCAPRDDDTTRCSAVDALQELPLELTRNMFGLGSGKSKKIALRLGGGCRLAALEPVRAARFHAFFYRGPSRWMPCSSVACWLEAPVGGCTAAWLAMCASVTRMLWPSRR